MKYRVGKKQSRVILDENGNKVAECLEGNEDVARQICDLLNEHGLFSELPKHVVSKSLPTKEEVIAEGDKQIDDWLSENHHKERMAYRVAFRRSFEYVLRKINVC